MGKKLNSIALYQAIRRATLHRLEAQWAGDHSRVAHYAKILDAHYAQAVELDVDLHAGREAAEAAELQPLNNPQWLDSWPPSSQSL